ncbi:MAG TPA: hypothetical protein ENN08_07195 [Bacteroidales bacterium]|nr:hypothetical protein [Bacteroidales bacterium]
MRHYFDLAPGKKLNFIIVDADEVSMAEVVSDWLHILIDGCGGEIRFVAIDSVQEHSILVANITDANSVANYHAIKYDPVIVFLPVKFSTLMPDLTTGSANRVGVFVSETGKEAGLLLGRLATTPVQRHIGRVKDGAMPITEFMIGDKKAEEADDRVAEVVAKGYITLGTIRGKSGYYYETQPLATDPSGDYAIISNRRVIDKAVLIAYQTYVNELKDEIEIAADGTIAPGVIKHYQGLIENAINLQMTANGNISRARAYMDAAQNVLSTGKIEVTLRILPVGYAEEIVVNLGFTTSLDE